jgi:hypothetical protein
MDGREIKKRRTKTMISKTVRRMLAVSLAAVMAVGSMAGCGKDSGTTTAQVLIILA